MLVNNRIVGMLYETYALQYLLRKNMVFLMGNFMEEGSEVDLVMQDGDELVFVEVKMRDELTSFGVIESVNKSKLFRVLKAGLAFIRDNNLSTKRYRVDVIFITLGVNKLDVEHYSDLLSC